MSRRYLAYVTLLASLLMPLSACGMARAEPMAIVTVDEPGPPPVESEEMPGEHSNRPQSDFVTQLIRAVEFHDFEQMESLMSDPFGFALWRSEGWANPPHQAVEQLQLNYLGTHNVIQFREAPDGSQELVNRDVLSVWNPDDNPIDALFSVGWGPQGQGEAFLIITQKHGLIRWGGIVYAHGGPDGFSRARTSHPDSKAAMPTLVTEVRYVRTSASLDEIPVRNGPSHGHAQTGTLIGGMGVHVIGASADGQWWRIICSEEVAGDGCWISADPDVTRPSVPPGL